MWERSSKANLSIREWGWGSQLEYLEALEGSRAVCPWHVPVWHTQPLSHHVTASILHSLLGSITHSNPHTSCSWPPVLLGIPPPPASWARGLKPSPAQPVPGLQLVASLWLVFTTGSFTPPFSFCPPSHGRRGVGRVPTAGLLLGASAAALQEQKPG